MLWGKWSLAACSGANCSRAWIEFNCSTNEFCSNFLGGMPAHCDVSNSFLSASPISLLLGPKVKIGLVGLHIYHLVSEEAFVHTFT